MVIILNATENSFVCYRAIRELGKAFIDWAGKNLHFKNLVPRCSVFSWWLAAEEVSCYSSVLLSVATTLVLSVTAWLSLLWWDNSSASEIFKLFLMQGIIWCSFRPSCACDIWSEITLISFRKPETRSIQHYSCHKPIFSLGALLGLFNS